MAQPNPAILMKTTAFSLKNALITGSVIALIVISGCSKDPALIYENDADPANSLFKTSIVLSEAEIASLMYMVEEEKLAMDVYNYLYELYGLQIFEKISDSELRHVSALSKIIDMYEELENPILDNLPGEFDNLEIQELYDYLIEMGSASRYAAIQVGILIEEKDIEDITEYITITEATNLLNAYNHLLDGSTRHLESFFSEL